MCCSTSRSRGVSWSRSASRSAARPRRRRRARERVEHEARQARREHRVALVHAAHGVGEVGAGDRLRHVAARAGADDRDDVLGGVGHREREELRRARVGADLAQHLQAAAVGHVDVEQDDVGRQLADQRDRVGDGRGVADDVDEPVELGAHARAKQRVVVDEDDARVLAPVAVAS